MINKLNKTILFENKNNLYKIINSNNKIYNYFCTNVNKNKDFNKIKFKINEIKNGDKESKTTLINQYVIENDGSEKLNNNRLDLMKIYDKEKENNKNNKTYVSIIESIKRLFLPKGYPNTVSNDYIGYQKWMFIQNTIGSVTYVLSTHALLTSVFGMSNEQALPLSAAISWVLKDGLGAMALVLFADKYSTLFDYDIKRYKFRGDLLHNLGVLLEMTTPFFQHHFFLPIASISNLSKGLAGLIYGSTRASLNRSFSLKENIGDITAKYQSQSMAAYLSGMAIGSSIGMILPTLFPMMTSLSNLSIVFTLSFIHIFSGIRAIKSLNLKTLNQQRTSIIIDHYLTSSPNNEILPSKIVNNKERFIIKGKHNSSPYIQLGSTIESSFKYNHQLNKSLNQSFNNNNNEYIITYNQDQYRSYKTINVLYFDQPSNNRIILKSFFHAFIIRKLINNRGDPEDNEDYYNFDKIFNEAQIMVDNKFDQFFNDLSNNETNDWNFNPNSTILMFEIGETKINLVDL